MGALHVLMTPERAAPMECLEATPAMSSSLKNIDVPADGLCFYHCIGAFLRSDTRTFRVDDALAIRSEVIRIMKEWASPRKPTV